jgi:hypothetical protein
MSHHALRDEFPERSLMRQISETPSRKLPTEKISDSLRRNLPTANVSGIQDRSDETAPD